MKIGIYGGSFNPPHNGHKRVADELLNKGLIDLVIFVPTGNFYKKKDLIDFEYRYEMLKYLCQNNILVSSFENQNKQIYTYQALDYFNKLYPSDQIYFICGSDNINEIESWKEYKYILNNYQILVVDRTNYKVSKKYNNVIYTNIEPDDINSTDIRGNIDESYQICFINKDIFDYIKENNLYDINSDNQKISTNKLFDGFKV